MSKYQRAEYWAERYRQQKAIRQAAKPIDPCATLSEIDLAYLAGLIDGEGCFQIGKTVRGLYLPAIQIQMVAEGLLKEIGQQLGVPTRRHSAPGQPVHWQEKWMVRVTGHRAIWLAKLLLPYLRLKRPHAELLIAFGETYKDELGREWGKVTLPAEVKQLRAEMKVAMHRLNARPVKSPTAEHPHSIDESLEENRH